jgi:polyhydroxyalkanoate synthesis repressor PhaR
VGETKKPVTIKKYANRRLYNTETSTYVTLDDLAQMVKGERDFVVYDAKTGEDLTHSVLTQIILEQESRGQNLLPINFLRQLIRFYGDNMGRLVPSYLDLSMGMLTREQEKFRKQMTETWGAAPLPFGTNPFGTAALEAMQEQARQNMAMFDKALAMFTPFGHRLKGEETEQATAAATAPVEPAPRSASRSDEPAAPVKPDELDILREQLAAMQRQIDRLAKDGR